MTKEDKLIWLRLIILVGFISAVIYHYILSAYFKLGYPYNTFVYPPWDSFTDFFPVLEGDFSTANYFPFAYLIIKPFGFIKPPILSLIIFWLIFLGFLACYLWTNVKNGKNLDSIRDVFIFLFFSFPVIFSLNRANFETFIFIFLALFIYYYQKNKTILSTVFLACAISMKLFPGVFIILLLSEKKYKQIIYTVLFVVILTLIPLLVLGEGFRDNIDKILTNFKNFNNFYLFHLDYSHSLFGVILSVTGALGINLNLGLALGIYSKIILTCFLFLSVYLIFGSFYFWEKVTILVFIMCLFPHVSYDYKLVHLFIPIFLFINWKSHSNDITGKIDSYFYKRTRILDLIIIVSFALLMIPKNYRLIFGFQDGIIIDPLLMIIVSIIILSKIYHRENFSIH